MIPGITFRKMRLVRVMNTAISNDHYDAYGLPFDIRSAVIGLSRGGSLQADNNTTDQDASMADVVSCRPEHYT
jgi:hypothetical protein